jgi:hypothetical protein
MLRESNKLSLVAALEEAWSRGGCPTAQRSKPDPALVAAAEALATARHAHHEAGHAVAAVFAGGTLKDGWPGAADWSTDDTSADTPGGTRHHTPWELQPFVTFAGPFAEAMWTLEHDDDIDDFYEALEYAWQDKSDGDIDDFYEAAWQDNSDGDIAKYESRVDELAVRFESDSIARAWELDWLDDLERLWSAVREVAAMLINGQPVTHQAVEAAVDRCLGV